jgi:hypothetical protein
MKRVEHCLKLFQGFMGLLSMPCLKVYPESVLECPAQLGAKNTT